MWMRKQHEEKCLFSFCSFIPASPCIPQHSWQALRAACQGGDGVAGAGVPIGNPTNAPAMDRVPCPCPPQDSHWALQRWQQGAVGSHGAGLGGWMRPPAWGWGRGSSPEVTAAPSWLWTSRDIGQGSHQGWISRRRHHGHSPGTRGRHRARSPRHHQPSQDGRQPWLCSTPSCRERAPGPEQPSPCLPAGRPRGSCKELKGLCQQQGSPRGSAGPRPPHCERGRSPLGLLCWGWRGSFAAFSSAALRSQASSSCK